MKQESPATSGQLVDAESLAEGGGDSQHSEARYRELYEKLGDGSAAVDMDGRIVRFNSAFRKMLGYDEKQIYELTYQDITPERWHASESRILQEQVMRRGYSDLYEKEYIRKGGTVFPVELRTYLHRDEDGVPTGMWAIVRDITERKRAEQEIQRASSDLRQIFNASVPSAVIARDFTILKVNDTFCTRFRLKREGIIGRKCYDAWTDPMCGTPACPVTRILEGAERYEYEWEESLSGRERAYFAVTAVPYRNPDGELAGIIENYTDVSERKRAEAELRKSQQMLRLIMDNIPQSIFWKDKNLNYLGCNPEFAADAGLKSADDIIGKNDYDLPWVAEAAIYQTDDRRVIETGKSKLNYEEPQTTPTGDRIWLRTSKVPLRDASGDVVAVLGMYEDITERKLAEERLRQSERRYRLLFDRMLDGFALYEANHQAEPSDYRFLEVNPAFETATGLAVADVINKTMLEVLPQTDPDHLKTYAEVVRRGESARFEEYSRDLDKYYEVLAFSPEPGRLATILTDLTERRRLEEQLRQAQKMESIGQLAGGIAHDFNNLLGGIMGFAELLRDAVGENSEVASCAQEIIDTSQRAADLISQLLAFSRRGKTRSLAVDVHEIIGKVVKLLEHTIDPRIRITQMLAAVPSKIIADPSQLQNAVLNLAVNARDAMPDGGRLTFCTSITELDAELCHSRDLAVAPGSYLELSVADTGVGIDKAMMDQIFEPFFTTKAVGKGTGLGLAAVYGIVKEHDGAVVVDSQLGKGSTFKLLLPLTGGEEREACEQRRGAVVAASSGILLVDDDAAIRKIAQRMLEDLGYQVRVAENGSEAIEIYRGCGREIDLVILDMMMPIMNGHETLHQLRQLDPDVRVLISSGYSSGMVIEDLPRANVAGFAQKPYRKQQLAESVAKALKPA